MFCPKCGKENFEDTKFCISCGQKLSSGKKIRLGPGSFIKNKRAIILFGLVIFCLVAASIFVYPKIKKGKVAEGEVVKSQEIVTLPVFDKDTPLSKKIELIKTGKDKYAAKVTLSLKNLSTSGKKNLEIVELIPKEFAQNVKEINFSTPPTKVLKDDPLIVWKFDELKPGEAINITYSVEEVSLSPQQAEEKFNQIANSYSELSGQVEEKYAAALQSYVEKYIATPVEPAPQWKENKFLQDFYKIYYRPYDQYYFPLYASGRTPKQFFEDQKNKMLNDANGYTNQAAFAQVLKTYYDFIGLYGNTVVKLDVIGAIDKLYGIYEDFGLSTAKEIEDAQNCYHLVEFADNLEKVPTILKDADVRKYFSDTFFQLTIMQQVEDQQQLDILRATRYGLAAKITNSLVELHEKAEKGELSEEEAQRLAYLEVAYFRDMAEITALEAQVLEWTTGHIDLSDIIFGWWFPGVSKEYARELLKYYKAYEDYFILSAEQRVAVINGLLGLGPSEKLVTKDVSQLALNQENVGTDFQLMSSDSSTPADIRVSSGLEQGYLVIFGSSGRINNINNVVLRYKSIGAAKTVFENIEKEMPGMVLEQAGLEGEPDIQMQKVFMEKIGDAALAYKITKTGEEGVVYTYVFRKWNIIEQLIMASGQILSEDDVLKYAKILEAKIVPE